MESRRWGTDSDLGGSLATERCYTSAYYTKRGDTFVTSSVLHPKLFTKTSHKHHVYVLVRVIKCVNQFLVT